jgi:uncharacterized protein YjeT (DUF2065 family)
VGWDEVVEAVAVAVALVAVAVEGQGVWVAPMLQAQAATAFVLAVDTQNRTLQVRRAIAKSAPSAVRR